MKQVKEGLKVNEEIIANEVRLIDEDGNSQGLISLIDARMKAQNTGLDLVEVAPDAKPPVCRLMDYGKIRFNRKKTLKEQKRNSKVQHREKGIRLTLRTEKHDRDRLLQKVHQFFEKGYKVSIALRLRGRERAFSGDGQAVIQQFIQDLQTKLDGLYEITVEQGPSSAHNWVRALISGKKTSVSSEKGTE